MLVIPDTLGGAPVVEIAAGAFADAPCKTVIFPDTLRRVQPGAFSGSAAESVTLFDNLQQISDYAFEDCTSLQTLYINAATAPVYSGSYYATFADKYDRLLSLADTQKLVLFSGSSARFGYDSAALDAALPHYEVVNMGVFAYTNALPQLELIRAQMRPGDLLLLSPEFDAAKRQFCTTNAFDDAFFCMAEADYDIVARLDLQQYSGVFSALGSYLQTRADMTARSYAVSPSDLGEDGNAVDAPSYNEYGDYVLYRPDAVDDTPIYGLPVDYTTASFPYDTYIAPANAEFDRFAADGVRVYLTYSPRNSRAVSADSTPEAVARAGCIFPRKSRCCVLDAAAGFPDARAVFLRHRQPSVHKRGDYAHGTGHRCTDKTTARGGDRAMIIVCALAALTTVLALVAHRRAWAAALGMVSGAAVVLAAAGTGCVHPHNAALPVDSLRRRSVADRRALMNFTAPAFVLLFPIVLALHWMLPPSRRWVLLLAASLGFYAVGSPQALPLLAGITLGTYAAALGIAKSKTQTAKKLWLTCAAVLCIGCLCLFKYAGIFRTDVPLLLPAGISFYTFQTLSYVIDIYRGRLMPERHPGYYAYSSAFSRSW